MRRFKQRLMFVLAVNLDQSRCERLELRQADRPAIDPRTRTAFAANHAAQLARAVFIEFFVPEPFAEVRAVAEVERRRELGAFAAVAHLGRVRAAAGEQQQRIDQQRLSGPGLAGDDGHAGAERDLRFGDDREILDGEGFQHGMNRGNVRRNASMGLANGQGAC